MNTNLLKTFFVALLLITATGASAHDFYVGGIYYNITDATAKTVEVTYKGGSYSEYDNEYTGSVVIPSMVTYNNAAYSVTSIGSNAFRDCRGLTGVTIPNSVTSIGDYAFQHCDGLTGITIPNSVTSIGKLAFYDCTGLTGITIPNSVTSIGSGAFEYCYSLKEVHISDLAAWCKIDFSNYYSNPLYYAHNLYLNGEKVTNLVIPDGVTEIKYCAFYGCDGLTSVTIPNSVTSIGNCAFSSCDGLTSITIPNSLTSIGGYAFQYCYGLTSVTIGSGVTSIGGYAFQYCYGLINITIPNSVTSIGDGAFYKCTGLTSITIPNSVTSIGNYVFYDCSGLTGELIIPNSVTSIGSSAFYDCSGLTGELIIPNSVTSIGSSAFYDCIGLTSITIPNSVTSIGSSAFYDCIGLKEVHISDLAAWYKIDFSGYVSNPLYYAHNLYLNGEKVTNLVIPDGVTEIKDCTFSGCRGLTSITIPNSVTSIGNYAFFNCTGLKTVYNLSELTLRSGSTGNGDVAYYADIVINAPNGSIEGDYIFDVLDGVNTLCGYIGNGGEITLPADYKGENYVIGADAFNNNTALTSVEIPNSVTSIGEGAFYNTAWYKNQSAGLLNLDGWLLGYKEVKPTGVLNLKKGERGIAVSAFKDCTELTGVVLGNSVTSIGNCAFSGCTGLINITIPNSVTSIGDSAFYKCTGLTSELIIPNSVTSIGGSTFRDCTGLTGITIPNSVTSIGNYAFYNCTGLEEVHISDLAAWCKIDFSNYYSNPLYYAHNLYLNGEKVTNLVIPDGITEIKKYAFDGCSGLTGITIPNSVTSIGGYAFQYCTGLTGIVIPNSVTSIGYNAFAGCTRLKIVYNNSLLDIIKGSKTHGCIALNACAVITDNNHANYDFVGDWIFTTVDDVKTLVAYVGSGSTIKLPEEYNGDNYVIGNRAFYYCTGLTSVTIGNSVTSIGNYAFYDCSGLTSITIPNSVTSIGYEAFYGCRGLTGITIPNSVTSIESGAFERCRGLTSITIPNSVTSIGSSAFSGCSGLKEIYSLSETPATISSDTFSDYSAMLYVPLGAKGAYQAAYFWKKFTNIVEIDVETGNAHYPLADWVSTNKYDNTTSSNTYSIVAIASSVLSFDWQVSSENGYDWFIVTLDGAEIVKSTGEDSGRYTYKFEQAGTYDLTAKYVKDDGYSKGDDCGKIYNILLTSPTDIDEIEADDSFNGLRDTYYDLKGRVVENPTKGIYIYNGKKVLVQ